LIDKPWINMESAIDHPCQSLADWKTMDELGVPANGGKFVISWAYHPRALPLAVTAATIHMAAKRGMNVVHLRPPGFELPAAIMDKARKAAAQSGGSVAETTERREAMEGAHVVYAKSYSSTRHYGDKLGDQALREELVHWCVDEPWFANARPDCRFMHCLPVRRGVEVADRILDGTRSTVIQGARNRLYAQMAVLYRMMKG
jgi:N-acetylornithine carbamoyltransferase